MSAPVVDVEALDAGDPLGAGAPVLTLADSKRLMGIRYSDWLLGAPSIEAGIAASSMAQDEWGHARLLYAMLKDLDVDPREVEHTRPRRNTRRWTRWTCPFPDWAAVVAGMVVVDGALTVALDAFCRGGFEPGPLTRFRRCSPRRSSTGAWAWRGTAGWPGAGRPRRRACCARRPRTHAARRCSAGWPPPTRRLGALAAAGLTDPGERQVAAFRDGVRDLVAAVGVDVDAVGCRRRVGRRDAAGAQVTPTRRRWSAPAGTAIARSSSNDVPPRRSIRRNVGTKRPEGLPQAPACPFCGGSETELMSAFGSHASVSTYWCRTCRSPFELMKWRKG